MGYGYFLGIGSNIDPIRHLPRALEQLLDLTDRIEVSRIVETSPVDLPTTGKFLNAAVFFKTSMDRETLKARLNAIECMFGRDRADPHRGSRDRTIDLDILLQIAADKHAIEPSQLTDEPYHRPLLIELLHTMGFACSVPAKPARPAIAVQCAGRLVGLTPFRLERVAGSHIPKITEKRAALVTGAAVRLGKAIAGSLAQRGYDIALHYNSSEQDAERSAAEFRDHGVRCEMFRYDLANPDDIGNLFDKVVGRLPQLDLLVNSASVYDHGSIADTTLATLDRQWAINLRAPFLLMQQFRHRVQHGDIINIVDNKIAYNQFHYAAYLTSKKALAELSKMAALEFAPHIRVNAIAPGVVMPAGTRSQSYLDWRKAAIPVHELGSPENICAMIAAVLDNRFINGQVLFVDGGEGMNVVGRNALEFGTV